MGDGKQIEIPFGDTPIVISGTSGDADREKFSSPEHQFPLLAGKMIRAYGPGPAGRTCGQCANYDRRRGCKAFVEGRPVAGKWESNWPACEAFDVTHPDKLRHMRLVMADSSRVMSSRLGVSRDFSK